MADYSGFDGTITQLVSHSDFPKPLQVHLEILRGRARNRLRPVRVPVFLIGSDKECDLVLGDAGYPEVYTYLFVTNSQVTMRHLGLPPQVQVDGKVVESAKLDDGQIIQLGVHYEFRVHIGIRGPSGVPKTIRIDAPEGHRQHREAARDQVLTLIDDIRQHVLTCASSEPPGGRSIRQKLLDATFLLGRRASA